jgi:glycosyltransferase involved in cell wall biosynthesis
VGDVGRTIPPQDVAAWSGALSQSWQDRDRLKNQALEAGVAWAGQFSWQRAAGETLAVYFEAFKQSGRQSRG